MNEAAGLTIRSLRVRAALVPMKRPLQTSTGTVGVAPLALIDLESEQGPVGHSYLFCYTPHALLPVKQLLDNLGQVLQGASAAPADLDQRLQGMFRLLGLKGVVGMALAGIDMAAWDLLARARGLPLCRLLGGGTRRIQAYNSNGLGMIGPRDAAVQAEELVAEGFTAIKVRLGYPQARTDLDVVRAVRRAVGEGVVLMADYNQALPVAEASVRTQMLRHEGLAWVEEPTRADDYLGHAQIRAKAGMPIQMGENWWGPHEMAACLAAGGSDLGMPDAMKIGGVTGWLRAAGLAEAAGMPLSSHLFPEVSAHLLAVTPTCHWLEYVDWATPILQHPMRVDNGMAIPYGSQGTGIDWNEEAVQRYLVP